MTSKSFFEGALAQLRGNAVLGSTRVRRDDEESEVEGRLRIWIRNARARLVTSAKTFGESIKSNPGILIIPLIVFTVLVVAGELQVYFLAKQYSSHRHQQAVDQVTRSAQDIVQKVQAMLGPLVATAEVVRQVTHVPTMAAKFSSVAESMISSMDQKNAISSINLLPWGVVESVYPIIAQGSRDNVALIGFKSFETQDPALRNGAIAGTGPEVLALIGPIMDGITGSKPQLIFIAGASLFLPISSPDENWGNNVTFTQPYAPHKTLGDLTHPELGPCGKVCSDVTRPDGTVLRYWGAISAAIQVDPIIKLLAATFETEVDPYKYLLYRQQNIVSDTSSKLKDVSYRRVQDFATVPDSDVLFKSPRSIEAEDNPECITVNIIAGVGTWGFCVVPVDGWDPSWARSCYIATPFIALVGAGLVMLFLLSHKRHKRLLRMMLPPKVIKHLSLGRVYAEPFQQVTILFSDIVGYTNLSSELEPCQLVELLNDIYSQFDTLAEKHGLYKVETIGDAFMCVGGAPDTCHPQDAAVRVARMAMDMVSFAEQYVRADGRKIQIRVGMHTGNVTAAVVGKTMPHWCLIGDAVNVASRMESNSLPMHIHVGYSTAALLHGNPDFLLHPRGEINVKGKGLMQTFFVTKPGDTVISSTSPSMCSPRGPSIFAASAHLPFPSKQPTLGIECDAMQLDRLAHGSSEMLREDTSSFELTAQTPG